MVERPARVAASLRPAADGPPPTAGEGLWLLSGGVLFQQGSLGHRIELLTRLAGAAAARFHPDELRRLGLAAGDAVLLEGPGGSLTLPVAADEGVPPGAVFVPYAHRDVELNRLGSPGGAGLRVKARKAGVAQRDGRMNGMIALFQDPTVQIAFWGLVKIVVILVVMLGIVAYLTFFERKVAGHIQSRPGPNLVGPWGLFQPFADILKLFLKEEFIPAGANKILFHVAPILAVTPALTSFAVVPIGPNFVVTDVNVGLLVFLAMSSLGVYALTLAGWSSNNKYALLGGLRSAAQMISYELALGLSTIGVILLAGSLSLVDIVHAQAGPSSSGRWRCRAGSCSRSRWRSWSSWSAPSPRPTARPSTCPRASPSWWAASTPSTRA